MAPAAIENAVSEDELNIPLIDFSLFLHGNEEQKKAVAKAMVEGFQNAGFVYLKNHGIPQEEVDQLFAHSAAFFRRPLEQKQKLAWYSARANRGYSSFGREKASNYQDKESIDALRVANPDLKESMEIGREDEPEYPNMWPDEFDDTGKEFKRDMNAFFETGKRMHVLVMRSIALGMGLEETFFDSYCDEGDNNLRLLHYPSCPKELFVKNAGQVRAGAHTDYGSITLLFQDDRGGLQVRSPNGKFINATPIPGTCVVNAGDLLARWSNDTIKSTMHQVVEPPIAPESGDYPARYSCVYFCNPNYQRIIEAIPGTYKTEADKKYPPIKTEDYMVGRLASTYL